MRKIQLPVIGGIRKTIEIPNSGTTIAEFGEGTVTLAQLKAALGIVTSSGSNTSSSAAGSSAASLVPGPGLSGGGVLIGSVPLNLIAPIPSLLWDDDTDDHMPFIAPPPLGRPVNKGANWASAVALVAGSVNTVYVQCPIAGYIKAVEIVTQGGPGSCVVDIWKVPFASFPPNSGNSICGGNLPTVSSGMTLYSTTLTGWTRDIHEADVLAFNLNSTSVFTQIQIVLQIAQQS